MYVRAYCRPAHLLLEPAGPVADSASGRPVDYQRVFGIGEEALLARGGLASLQGRRVKGPANTALVGRSLLGQSGTHEAAEAYGGDSQTVDDRIRPCDVVAELVDPFEIWERLPSRPYWRAMARCCSTWVAYEFHIVLSINCIGISTIIPVFQYSNIPSGARR